MNQIENTCKVLIKLWKKWKTVVAFFPYVAFIVIGLGWYYSTGDSGSLVVSFFPLSLLVLILTRSYLKNRALKGLDRILESLANDKNLTFNKRKDDSLLISNQYSSQVVGKINGTPIKIEGYWETEFDKIFVISTTIDTNLNILIKYLPLKDRIFTWPVTSLIPFGLKQLVTNIKFTQPQYRVDTNNQKFNSSYIILSNQKESPFITSNKISLADILENKATLYINNSNLFYILTHLPSSDQELRRHLTLALRISSYFMNI